MNWSTGHWSTVLHVHRNKSRIYTEVSYFDVERLQQHCLLVWPVLMIRYQTRAGPTPLILAMLTAVFTGAGDGDTLA